MPEYIVNAYQPALHMNKNSHIISKQFSLCYDSCNKENYQNLTTTYSIQSTHIGSYRDVHME